MLPPRILQRLERALRDLEHGSVELVIHDGHVVRIERIERLRLTVPPEAQHRLTGRPTESSEVRPHDALEG